MTLILRKMSSKILSDYGRRRNVPRPSHGDISCSESGTRGVEQMLLDDHHINDDDDDDEGVELTELGVKPSNAIRSNILNPLPDPADRIMISLYADEFENGPCETNAALEFSVNALQVRIPSDVVVTIPICILLFVNSKGICFYCGGIRALMSMDDEDNSSSFIKNWVVVGKAARSSTKATTSKLGFDQQCKHFEKELINNSLLNLLSAFVSEDDEETRAYKSLFQNKTFFLGREVRWSNERPLKNKELNAIIGAWFTLWRD
ncbi:beta carbonic anhydrase 5, chloroplastic isoform X2 [Tanacetum coccineum]